MAKEPNNVQDALDDIEKRLEALESAPKSDTDFEQRLSVVEQRDPHAQITAFEQRLDAVENRSPGATISRDDFQALTDRVTALENAANNPDRAVSGAPVEIDAAHVNYVMHKFFPHDRPT